MPNILFINKAILHKKDSKIFGRISNKNEKKYDILNLKYKKLKGLYSTIIKSEVFCKKSF